MSHRISLSHAIKKSGGSFQVSTVIANTSESDDGGLARSSKIWKLLIYTTYSVWMLDVFHIRSRLFNRGLSV